MTHGIETGNKKEKYRRHDDEKWLLADLRDIKRTVEKYITSLQSVNENKADLSGKKSDGKRSTIDRFPAIGIFGVFGSIILLAGDYLLIKGNYVVGIPGVVFGTVFVLALILYENYR